nr:TRAP transporter small permease [Marivibrio halodurans]
MLIVASFCFEVVARYLFQSPTSWAQEVVSYGFCISIFSMLPHLTRTKAHVGVTILVDGLAPGRRFWAGRAIAFAGFVVCGFVAWIGFDECVRQYTRNVFIAGIHSVPQWWLTAFIVYGFALSAIHFLREAITGDFDLRSERGVL